MKTKVTLVKDTKYLKDRTKMVERFMTEILNRPQLNCQICEETRKFLSEKEFDLFKKSEKESKKIQRFRRGRDDKFFLEQIKKHNEAGKVEQVQMCE